NFTVNRYSGIDLAPGSVRVTYVLDLAEIPTYQETPSIDTNADGTITDAERQAWAGRTAAKLLAGLRLELDGAALPLQVQSDAMTLRPGQAGLPILRLVVELRAEIAGPTGRMTYRDTNDQDRIGWREITARAEPGLALDASTVPTTSVSQALLAYPVDML